jgi:sulfite reductase (ferredoxin)
MQVPLKLPVPDTMPEEELNPVELVKEQSNYLRGQIAQELVDGSACFGKDSVQLLKHHGAYQQDDRDARAAARSEGGAGKAYMYLVRTAIPGGVLTSEQMLAELELCDEIGNTTLRITSRQGLQLHGVLKENLKHTIRRINEIQLTTLAACGDVKRNLMCCPGPYRQPIYAQTQELARQLAEHLKPRTRAYHELWVQDQTTGEKELAGGGPGAEEEPIYGPRYLPRKFKIGIGFCFDNCIDIYTNDLGLLAIVRDGQIVGYNVLVGGGMGVTPSAKKTFPAVARRMAFITPDQALDVSTAIVKVQRDFGNREDRKVARLKYLLHNWGLERFKAKVEEYYGRPLPEPQPDDVHDFNDHLGWDEQGDGKLFYGLNVENGRIKDDKTMQLKSAIREICRKYQPGLRLTAHQSLLFTDIAPPHRADIEDILRRHHVRLTDETSMVRRRSMACVAFPTCGLAITESERALPGVLDRLEAELAKLGLERERFLVRMTGCPNGCVRPYNCDIGLVGKTKGKYTIYVGGRLLGDRLNFVFRDLVPQESLVPALVPLFVYFKQARSNGESFGDFCHRQGRDALLAWTERYQSGAA